MLSQRHISSPRHHALLQVSVHIIRNFAVSNWLTEHVPCSFFKTLIDHEVTVELKNDIQLRGTLKSVDQYLNIKLDDISVVEELKYPHLVRNFGLFFLSCLLRDGILIYFTELCKERVYSWFGRPIRSLAC